MERDGHKEGGVLRASNSFGGNAYSVLFPIAKYFNLFFAFFELNDD